MVLVAEDLLSGPPGWFGANVVRSYTLPFTTIQQSSGLACLSSSATEILVSEDIVVVVRLYFYGAFLAGAYLTVTCKYRNNVVSIHYSQPGNKLLTYTMKGGGSRRSSPHFGLRCGDCRGCLFSSTSHRLRYLGCYTLHA